MINRKGQTISIDTYVAIGLFLVAIIFFYSLIGLRGDDSNLTKDSSLVSHKVREGDIFGDGVMDVDEEAILVEMNCDEIKALFETTKEVCIYFRDTEGKVVPLSNGTSASSVSKYGVGCEGVIIGNHSCGTIVT